MSLPDANNIALVRQMMETLGVSAADLVSAATAAPEGVPTVEAFHATVLALATDGQRRTYANHWRSLVAAYGDRPVNSQGMLVEKVSRGLYVAVKSAT